MSNIIYEVNLTIAPARVDEFDKWLAGHIDDMLGLPGFIDAQTFHGTDNQHAVRRVQYRLTDANAYEQYVNDNAERMQAKGREIFGNDVQAQRRIVAPATRSGGTRCLNCDAVLDGQYCTDCGQRHRTRMITVWELLRDVSDDLLSWDSRLWRSLRPLLLAPGKLTLEYLNGRRTYYTPPLRMYLVLSVLFFLLSNLPSFEDISAESLLGLNRDATSIAPAVDSAQDAPCQIDEFEVDMPGVDDELLRMKAVNVCLAMQSPAGRQRLLNEFLDMLPTVFIIMLPVIALASRLLYLFRPRYYVEHLLFYTHYQSFVFFMLLVLLPLDALMRRVAALEAAATLLQVGAGGYAVYYLYRALRRVFAQGRALTLIKMALISVTYAFTAGALMVTGLAIAALSIG